MWKSPNNYLNDLDLFRGNYSFIFIWKFWQKTCILIVTYLHSSMSCTLTTFSTWRGLVRGLVRDECRTGHVQSFGSRNVLYWHTIQVVWSLPPHLSVVWSVRLCSSKHQLFPTDLFFSVQLFLLHGLETWWYFNILTHVFRPNFQIGYGTTGQ